MILETIDGGLNWAEIVIVGEEGAVILGLPGLE